MESTKLNGWEEIHWPEMPTSSLKATGTKCFCKGPCRVLLSCELSAGFPRPAKRWHLSISCVDRYPTWDEIKDARYTLLPMGITFAQILPPLNDYVNLRNFTFHLWEIDWHG